MVHVSQWQLARLMAVHNQPHPGQFIDEVYLEPNGIRRRELASKLGFLASTLNRLLTGKSGISPEMALRLSMCLGRSPASWLAMQHHHDIWQAKRHVELSDVERLKLSAA
jgi:antitoxin HigA-1